MPVFGPLSKMMPALFTLIYESHPILLNNVKTIMTTLNVHQVLVFSKIIKLLEYVEVVGTDRGFPVLKAHY